jgi:hypothetical protein
MKGVIRRTRRTLAVVTLALAGCSGAMRAPTSTPEVIPLYFVADTSTSAMLNELSVAYRQDNELVAIVDGAQLDSSVSALLNDNLPPDTTQPPRYAITTTIPADDQLWAAPLGYEGIAIITHTGTRLNRLVADDLRQIFARLVNNWQAFGGPDREIVVVSQPPEAPLQAAFNRLVMGQRDVTLAARLALTPQHTLQIVQQTPGAIGVVPLSLSIAGVNVIPVAEFDDAIPVSPTRETIANGIYPLQTPVLIVGNAPPQPGDGYYEFILWAQQGEGRAIVSQYYAPLALAR